MLEFDQKKEAKEFSERWKDKGKERSESQKFWLDLLNRVYGVKIPSMFIEFEDVVHIDKNHGFIDGFINKTKVMIEQKSIEKNLRSPIAQSDGTSLTPFQQAKRYSLELPYDDRPRWIVTCNFKSFLIYDMNKPSSEPVEILLENLEKEYYLLSFLVDENHDNIKKEEIVSIKAGELVGLLYDALSKEYKDISLLQSQKDLNELCVRLVFCLYAEDAGLFGKKNIFHDYLSKSDTLDSMRSNLKKLFEVLDTKLEDRDPYLSDDLNQFPYVNGGLFSNKNIEIPYFTKEIKAMILSKASDEFDWSEISPTIFGAVFESTLNPETRKNSGMHYTSINNIHKVIDPLFLNNLRSKLAEAKSFKNEKIRIQKLYDFQKYLSTLIFLDPACGSGNFLTETYLSLRRLENEAISTINGINSQLEFDGLILVSINQFYGIEINDFAVKVAKTALWIAEAQMWTNTCKLTSTPTKIMDFLPLNSYDNIIETNALTLDWNEIVKNTDCNYIIGNPPFLGRNQMNSVQKDNMLKIFPDNKTLDFVCAWFKKSSEFIENTKIEVAFLSTNSITQGEQASLLWKDLFNDNISINFAYTSFKWTSEALDKAGVYCVIIGFAKFARKDKIIYSNNTYIKANNISPYLIDYENVLITNQAKPICKVSKMVYGSKPVDDGFLSCYSKDEINEIIEKYPETSKFLKKIVGADEFIKGIDRYCLWLDGVSPCEMNDSKFIKSVLSNVRTFRENSSKPKTKELANTPYLFAEIRQPRTNYLLVPVHSSNDRKYIPIGFMDKDIITTNGNLTIPNATLYEFGVLTSNLHMLWNSTICGRLGESFRYSAKIVYNNFPWCNPNEMQKKSIEKTAQAIIDARNLYSDTSFADLYNPNTMPRELLKAHKDNDNAVMNAYGFKDVKSDSDCIIKLLMLYKKIISTNK